MPLTSAKSVSLVDVASLYWAATMYQTLSICFLALWAEPRVVSVERCRFIQGGGGGSGGRRRGGGGTSQKELAAPSFVSYLSLSKACFWECGRHRSKWDIPLICTSLLITTLSVTSRFSHHCTCFFLNQLYFSSQVLAGLSLVFLLGSREHMACSLSFFRVSYCGRC